MCWSAFFICTLYIVHCVYGTSQLRNLKYNNFTKENHKVDAWPWLYFYCDFFLFFLFFAFSFIVAAVLLVFFLSQPIRIVYCVENVYASLSRIRDHLMNFYRAIFNCNSNRDQFMAIRNTNGKKWQWTWTTAYKQTTISIEWENTNAHIASCTYTHTHRHTRI